MLEEAWRVLGCGGIAPLAGGEPDVCELRKMYLLPEARGRGLGERMLHCCLEAARVPATGAATSRRCPEWTPRRGSMPKRDSPGYAAPLGTTGHSGCNRHYLLEL